MRIATITNWAYGVTVCLTIASGIVMLMASHADNVERQAVKQRQIFDQLTEEIEAETWMLSDLARLYAIKKEPDVLKAYQAKEGELKNIEHKVGQLKDTGATGEELALLYEGLKIVDGLQDEQQAAIASVARGEEQQAIALLFGKIYELETERAQSKIDHFRMLLDKRIIADVQAATNTSKTLRTASEVMVGLTALLFLFVMGFILKHRVLRPVVRLSDVVHRLASQDYAVETPNFNQVDEIGDMAQAIRIFRENGLARQRLEKERDADWAIRELLARMTQRLQGCENVSDVIEVAELFAPNIAPVSPDVCISWIETRGRCAVRRNGYLHREKKMLSTPINAGPYAVVRATHRSTASRISVASICLNHKKTAHCACRSLRRGKPLVCCRFRTSRLKRRRPAHISN